MAGNTPVRGLEALHRVPRFVCCAALAMGEKMTKKMCQCTLGAVMALMLAPAAVAGADSPDTDAANKDVEFTNYLASNGIHLGTASETGNMGRTMCQDLAAGYTQNDEMDQLKLRMDAAQARLFVLAAIAEYCPEKHKS